MNVISIILAAGQGTRMRSSLPKVLHAVGGKPMLQHVIEACRSVNSSNIVIVYGHGGDRVQQTISSMTNVDDLSWAEQKEQKGTGHAVLQAEKYMDDDAVVVVAYGDVPLIKAETLKNLSDKLKDGSSMVVLTTLLDNPFGYGRIIRNQHGQVECIVEEKDANAEQRTVKEVNTGFIASFSARVTFFISFVLR
jgi:bifunctional UDP-N-acetylglucosamine pyrophosphorylase/glucosamine-1-phosphate N-acetyltransferase